jgi:hypothetical protein
MQRDGQRDRVGGDRKSLSRRPTMKLPGLGITRDQSSQWQALAAWPGSRRPVSGDQKPTTFHTLSIHGPGVLAGPPAAGFGSKQTRTFPELFPNHDAYIARPFRAQLEMNPNISNPPVVDRVADVSVEIQGLL